MEITKLFTPMLNGVRQRWENVRWLSGRLTRGKLGLMGTVQLEDGRKFKVYGKSCGLTGCICDARVKEIK